MKKEAMKSMEARLAISKQAAQAWETLREFESNMDERGLLSSRQVAEMYKIEHKDVVFDIEELLEIIDESIAEKAGLFNEDEDGGYWMNAYGYGLLTKGQSFYNDLDEAIAESEAETDYYGTMQYYRRDRKLSEGYHGHKVSLYDDGPVVLKPFVACPNF